MEHCEFIIHNVPFYVILNLVINEWSDGMGQTDLVCLGDSIVYGYGVHPRYAWPRVVSERLGIHVLNRGENGDTSAGMRARFNCDVIWNHPKEVFVMAGANDILMGTPLVRTCENMERMIEKALTSDIRPIVGIPIQVDGEMLKLCWYSYFSIEETMNLFRKYREWLIGFCTQKKIPYVDFQKKYPEYLERAGVSRWYQDGVHPTKEGYMALADIFCDTYKEIKML